jgi:cytochrome c
MRIYFAAQFGVQQDVPIGSTGEEEVPQGELSPLTEQDAVDIAALIEAAGEDPQTIKVGYLFHYF